MVLYSETKPRQPLLLNQVQEWKLEAAVLGGCTTVLRDNFGVGNDLASPEVWKGVINIWDILLPKDGARNIFHWIKIAQRKYFQRKVFLDLDSYT